MSPEDCWNVTPAVLPENELSWSLWKMFGRRWAVAPMGGLIGWDGYGDAQNLLIHGHRLRGDALVQEMERLKGYEEAQMEIDAKRREKEQEKAEAKKRKQSHGMAGFEDVEHVEGDLDDFFDDDEEQESEP